MLTTQKLHAILRKAGFRASKKSTSGMVRGLYDWSYGYHIKEVLLPREDMPFNPRYRDKGNTYHPAKEVKIYHKDDTQMPKIIETLAQVGIECEKRDGWYYINLEQSPTHRLTPGAG